MVTFRDLGRDDLGRVCFALLDFDILHRRADSLRISFDHQPCQLFKLSGANCSPKVTTTKPVWLSRKLYSDVAIDGHCVHAAVEGHLGRIAMIPIGFSRELKRHDAHDGPLPLNK